MTATRSSKPKDHDFLTVGRNVVERLIGEKLSGEPLDNPNAGEESGSGSVGEAWGR
jgi:hypothetical protein